MGCVTWTLGLEHFAVLHNAHRKLLHRIIAFHRRQRADHRMSCAKPLENVHMRERLDDYPQMASHFCGGGKAQRANPERLARRVMFDKMAGRENPGPGRPGKTWARCLVDDIAVFRAKEGSTETPRLLFGVEMVLWSTAAKQAGKWYRGIAKAADGFMARWHRAEAEKCYSTQTRTPRNRHVGRARKRREGGGGGAAVMIPLSIKAEKKCLGGRQR